MPTTHLHLITGASRGLGRAMAEQLLEQPGNHVLLGISRRQSPELAEHAKKKADNGNSIELIQWEQDLSDPIAAAARVREWLAAQDPQRFDTATLINNAGTVGNPAPLSASDDADLSQALRIGLEAPMLLTAAFLGGTRSWRGARKVLNISSGLGRNAMGSQAPYCAAKAGMDHYSRAVALEEASVSNGARIVSLAPGVIDTDMQVQLRGTSAEKFPDRGRFEKLKSEGLLDSPASAAAKVLKYLARANFGSKPVADVRDTD
jgi:NAD(P)-dependent dehydrogenase (short-subunit alcohol dehydrogenase family)